MTRTLNLLATGLMAFTLSASAMAQSNDTKPAEPKPAEHQSYTPRPPDADFVVKTYHLSNVSQQNDANEILIAMRNMLQPWVKMYLVSAENAVLLDAPPDQQALAEKIIADLDRPQKTYRLTFTFADSDSGKRVGIQHIAMIVAAGQRTVLKQGDKIPVATGTYGKGSDPMQTQFQYLDIGMSLDATLEDTPNGLQLKSKIEESSLGQPSTIAGVEEPVIRQTLIEGISKLTTGKPLTLGSVDLTGTTRHIDIEVVAEPVS